MLRTVSNLIVKAVSGLIWYIGILLALLGVVALFFTGIGGVFVFLLSLSTLTLANKMVGIPFSGTLKSIGVFLKVITGICAALAILCLILSLPIMLFAPPLGVSMAVGSCLVFYGCVSILTGGEASSHDKTDDFYQSLIMYSILSKKK